MIKDNGISKDYLTELKRLNQNFINKIANTISTFPTVSGLQNSQQLFLSNDTSKLLEKADEAATELKDEYINY